MNEEIDPRRQRPIKVEWSSEQIGLLSISGIHWGAVEWSEKRQAWCIEDAEGGCLRHTDHVHGQAASRDAAVTLAREMIRDGRMPTPEEAKRRRREQVEGQRKANANRANQPSRIRQREERKKSRDLMSIMFDAEHRDECEPPFYQLFDDAFDLNDPDLWKSNAFAMLRPRLIVSVEANIARLEYEALEAKRGRRFATPLDETEQQLTRARKILRLLRDGGAT
jgi:hypothetical protein